MLGADAGVGGGGDTLISGDFPAIDEVEYSIGGAGSEVDSNIGDFSPSAASGLRRPRPELVFLLSVRAFCRIDTGWGPSLVLLAASGSGAADGAAIVGPGGCSVTWG